MELVYCAFESLETRVNLLSKVDAMISGSTLLEPPNSFLDYSEKGSSAIEQCVGLNVGTEMPQAWTS